MSLLNDILEHMELGPDQLAAYIDEYETVQPYDCMIDTARAVVALSAFDYRAAEEWILSAIRKNPANYWNRLYRALIAKALGQFAVAAEECYICFNFATQFGTPPDAEALLKRINEVLNEVGPKLSPGEQRQFVIQRNILQTTGSFFPSYLLADQKKWSLYQGDFLYFDPHKTYNDYVCIKAQSYIDWINGSYQQTLFHADDRNVYALTPIEIWKAAKTRRALLKSEHHLVAVAATIPNQAVTISTNDGKTIKARLAVPNIYHYFNMDKKGSITSNQELLVSKPISTAGVPQKKKLILTIFVDAVSQWYLTETNYEFMPYTKAFFEEGTIFKNCFSTGEWTHPSVASWNTGLYSTRHHIIYRSSAYRYPEDTKTASELLNDDGYFTVCVSGSVGTSPYIGGARGYDCSVRRSCAGFPDSALISDALDFLEAVPNSNQYLSLELFEMHRTIDSSEGCELSLSMPQQATLGLCDSIVGLNTEKKKKSVWKGHSESFVKRYQAAMRDSDRRLKQIYDYITEHYSENEYIVCLYSDHGVSGVSQESYLLKLSQTNSALMLRGGGVPAGISEEYINHIDYLPILTKLAGIDADFSQYDCVLPRTFGGPGRDYVYTESIYQGQTYKAAVRTDEFECRFEANANTDIDGLIDLSQGYTQKIFSIKTGEEIHDPELAEDFEAIVLDHIKENIKY